MEKSPLTLFIFVSPLNMQFKSATLLLAALAFVLNASAIPRPDDESTGVATADPETISVGVGFSYGGSKPQKPASGWFYAAIKTFQMKDPTERTTSIGWLFLYSMDGSCTTFGVDMEMLCTARQCICAPTWTSGLSTQWITVRAMYVGCKHRTKVPLAENGLRRPARTLPVNVANLDIYEYVTWLPQRHQAGKYPDSTLASCIYHPVSMLLLCECM